jgi:hypothetical protein
MAKEANSVRTWKRWSLRFCLLVLLSLGLGIAVVGVFGLPFYKERGGTPTSVGNTVVLQTAVSPSSQHPAVPVQGPVR